MKENRIHALIIQEYQQIHKPTQATCNICKYTKGKTTA